MLSFQHIDYLFGLALVLPLLLFFLYTLWWKRKVKKQIGDPELVNALIQDHSSKKYNVKFILLIVAIALCVVAAANLRTPKEGASGNRAGIDVMVALDVSNSMLAQDIKPNRLERARQVLNKIIEKMGDNRMGLVLFAGQAFLQMPLTSDLGAAKLYVSNANPDAVPTQGTVIGDALRLCNASLDTKEKKYKAVILISDGEGHDEKALDAVKELQDNGVIIHTIGIGSPDGAPIYDPGTNGYKKDESGNTVISKLNEKDLQEIASQTGGAYHLFSNADAITNDVMGSLNQMEKKQTGGANERTYTTYFQWFLLVAFILLVLEVIIPERKMKWLSRGKITLMIAFMAIACSVHAQEDQSLILEGNQLYKEKQYDKAIDQYQKATNKDEKNPKAKYNLGNALYRSDKKEAAQKAYDAAADAAKDANIKSKALYNKGVTYSNGKKLPESIDAYKEALKINPADNEARENLQKALNELKKQQPPPKQDQKKNDKQDQKKNNQNQNNSPQNNSKLNQKQAEKMLNALRQQEKKLQQDQQKKTNTGGMQEKDW